MTDERRGRMLSMIAARLGVPAAILFVLFVYMFFATYGEFAFHSRPWHLLGGRPGDAYYAALAEGFRQGRLSMPHVPVPSLTEMPNPWDDELRKARNVPYLWDASYFNGRYYLYFTPLPVLLFYMPFRVVYGLYPSDQLAAAVFAAWAFLFAMLFVRRALTTTPQPRHVPLPLWILLIGLGNVVPFVMVFSRTYEVAALCGMAMTATWAWSLLRYLASPTTSRLIWMSLWLGLSIAARPNLGVLLPAGLIAVAQASGLSLIRSARRQPGALRQTIRSALIASIPLAIIGGSILAYNYARFRQPFEFGLRYQLTQVNMAEHRVCGLCSGPELLRLLNTSSLYLFAPPQIGGEFPFVDLPQQRLGDDAAIAYNPWSEEVGGLTPLAPLTIIGGLFAIILILRKEPKDVETRAAVLAIAAGWLVLLGLSSCWFVTARYALDFWLLITAGAIVCVERGLTWLANAGVSIRPLRFAAIFLAGYSIVIGILIGFKGTNDEFGKANPELFQRLSELF